MPTGSDAASNSIQKCGSLDTLVSHIHGFSGWETASLPVFLTSAAEWLRAGRSSLHQQLDNCKLACLPCISGRVTVSQSVFLASADSVAARRLTVAVCAPDKLSQCKHSFEWLVCQRSAFLYALIVAPNPMGVGPAMVHTGLASTCFNVGGSHKSQWSRSKLIPLITRLVS
jgi:hypothetical protein